ncbi:MAG: hypothetical protein JST86_09505 [Bacteroidetes bacterium]|nr:hypothetical protein [Bacteroidota bacterium]
MKILVIVVANLLLFGCAKKHDRTDRICDGKLYVEIYTEWSGMGACYITDSTKFRVKVDRFNFESEFHKYYCKSDSLIIEKWSKDELTPNHFLEKKIFYLTKLIEEGKFDK